MRTKTNMKPNWDKILTELSVKVRDGIPDLTNEQHLIKLWDVLREQKWNLESRVELIKTLTEKLVPNPNPSPKARKKMVTIGYARTFYKKQGVDADKLSDDEIEKKAKEDNKKKKSKSKDGEPKPPKKNAIDFENDTTEDIVRKTGGGEFKETNQEQSVERVQKDREEVFNGKSGKGGGDTTAQEEMANMSREISVQNPDMSQEELEEAMWKEIQEKYPDSKYAKNEKRTKKLIKKSTAGRKTIKEVQSNEEYDYGEQPNGYPTNTTNGEIVRDTLLTEYEKAKADGDKEAMAHYERELKWMQKKATDKSVTGKEGDADTMMVYKDKKGRTRVLYVTNKQGEADMQSNSTIETVSQATTENVHPDAEPEVVNEIQKGASEQATGFNNKYVKRSSEVIRENREDLSKVEDVIGKAAQAQTGRSSFHNDKPDEKYLNENKKNPEVQAKLLGMDNPPNDDPKSKEYKEWRKKVKNAWNESEQNFTPEQVVQASLDSTGTGSVQGIGTGASSVPYTTVKATQVTRDLRNRVKDMMKKNPNMTQKEACEAVAKDKRGKKGEERPLYGGQFSGDDIERIMDNKGLEALEQEQEKRARSMDGMYEETTNGLRSADVNLYISQGLSEEEALERSRNEAGPHEQSYTAGFMERMHWMDYISGDVDGRVVGEMGENSHPPRHIRECLAEQTGFDGDPNTDNEKLKEHILKNVRADSENQTLTFVNKQSGETRTLGNDTHRLAGRNEKMAGAFGVDMVKCLKSKGAS